MQCSNCSVEFDMNNKASNIKKSCSCLLCSKCSEKLEKRTSNVCPSCKKPRSAKKYKLTKIDWISSICQTHSKVNEMICKFCCTEICVNCIKNHNSNEHDVDSIEQFLKDYDLMKNDYQQWIKKAKIKSSKYDDIITKYATDLKNKVNAQYESLIEIIKKSKDEAIAQIETKCQLSNFKSFFLQGEMEIKQKINEFEGYSKTDKKKKDILQRLEFYKKNQDSTLPIRNWAQQEPKVKELDELLLKIQYNLVEEVLTQLNPIGLEERKINNERQEQIQEPCQIIIENNQESRVNEPNLDLNASNLSEANLFGSKLLEETQISNKAEKYLSQDQGVKVEDPR